jgi:hypothetical protein
MSAICRTLAQIRESRISVDNPQRRKPFTINSNVDDIKALKKTFNKRRRVKGNGKPTNDSTRIQWRVLE